MTRARARAAGIQFEWRPQRLALHFKLFEGPQSSWRVKLHSNVGFENIEPNIRRIGEAHGKEGNETSRVKGRRERWELYS